MRQAVPNLPTTTAILRAKTPGGSLVPLLHENAADKPAETISKTQWARVIGLIADGVKAGEAVIAAGISRYTLEGILRTDAKRKEQWEDAKIAAIRRLWDLDTLDEIFVDIAAGKFVKVAVGDRGLSVDLFYKLVLNDPVAKGMYDDALKIQAETMADDIIAIADHTDEDQYVDSKGNVRVDNEVVNRSRLKVDARKWKMAKLHWKRFGDRVQQDVSANIVVDTVARLEEARKRVEEGKRVVSVQEKNSG